MNKTKQNGFTLLEASMVVAISSIVAGAAIPSMQGLLETRRLSAAASQLASDIQLVRSEAALRNRTVRLSVRSDAGATCYVIHTGAASQCSCAADGPAICTGDAEQIKTVRQDATSGIQLQANVGSITFDPLHGTSSPTGTLRVIGGNGREVRHVINLLGRVRSCTPQGIVPGYRAC